MSWINVLIGIVLIVLVITTAITSPEVTLEYGKAMLKSAWIIGKLVFEQGKIFVEHIRESFPKNATVAK